MILAGDIGGTKTHLALFDWTAERVEPVTASARNWPVRMSGSVGAIVANCMSSRPVIRSVTDCAELL